jgi:oligoendopeptidase F
VLGSLTRFEPQAARLAERVLAEDHLDSEVRPGKRSGAFCASTVPGQTPWVLSNFQGRADDVATLAHELGHAIHSMLAAHHSVFTFHSSLPLAETASTFSEMLLIDRMLAEESDRACGAISCSASWTTPMLRSVPGLFALEKEAHGLAQKVTTDELCQAYREPAHQLGGGGVLTNSPGMVSIPHIYDVPFSVRLCVRPLLVPYNRSFWAEGKGFIPRYLNCFPQAGRPAPTSSSPRRAADGQTHLLAGRFRYAHRAHRGTGEAADPEGLTRRERPAHPRESKRGCLSRQPRIHCDKLTPT